MKNAEIKDLLDIYDLEIRKNCRNKRKIYNFEKNKMQNISYIKYLLENDLYYPRHYNIFIIRDPKYRIVMSLNISDKIINHYLARHVLIEKLDKYLDFRSVATRKGYGSDYGIKLVKKYLEKNKKNGLFYILKIDIKKYFYNIDHGVLKSLLINELDESEYLLLSRIIDSTDSNYVNLSIQEKIQEEILKRPRDYLKIKDLPIYKKGKGLSLGAMTSQFLSIFYTNRLIHYIVHDLKLKYTIIYMDDIIIMHKDKDYLYKCLDEIKSIINSDLKLEINEKKTKIVSSYEGFTFLGYKFFIRNNKTIMKIKKDTLVKVKRRVKKIKYLYDKEYISFEKVFCSLNTYLYSFKYVSNFKVVKIVNKYFFSYYG
ncbi:MAG: hypothetical protein IJ501_04940 [Bacilli bacterium]|nr:hypothetical protein [Bacilli bacterium]